MKALAVVLSTLKVNLVDIDKPSISFDEVLVKTISVGIDRTDIDIFKGLYGETPPNEQWLIPGHEAVGQVKEVGEKVIDIKKGDFVVPTVRKVCELCIPCSFDEPDMCQSQAYTERGIKQEHGFLSEFFSEKPKNLVKIPPDLVPLGSLIEPMSIAQKAVEHILKIQQRFNWQPKTALVLGAGPLGLLAALILRARDFHTYVFDIVDVNNPKAKLVENIGAFYVDGRKINIEELSNSFGKLDIIIEATGNSEVAFKAINNMNLNAITCLLSITPGQHSKRICTNCLNDYLVLGNRVIFGSVSSNRRHFEQAIKTAGIAGKKWPGYLDNIITEKITFKNYKKALTKKDNAHIKSIIYF